MATSADPRRTAKDGRERFFAPLSVPSDAGGTKNSPLRGRVRLFRVLLPRRRHSENLACDAVCPMGLSRAIARRATLSKRGNSRGRYDRVPSASNFANARSTLRATRWTPAFSGAACFKNTPRLTLGLQPSYTEPDASTARPETTAVWVARRVRGPWHADGGTLECVLFNVGGRATGAVGRRARIASDGAGDGDAPFSMARQTFSRRTREIYPSKRAFFAKTWEKSHQLLIHDCIFGNC